MKRCKVKPKKPPIDIRVHIRTFACVLAAVMVLLMVIPSAAADETCANEDPDTEAVLMAEETAEDECDDDEKQPDLQEHYQEGYITMTAVSGNISITN